MSERILLVEDDPRDVEIALDVIAHSPDQFEVLVLADGEEALDYLGRKGRFRLRSPSPPSFIILDVKMPKLDGFEVLRRLRAEPELSAIPVILLTASRQEQDLMSAYELEADGYLTKPLKAGMLESVLRTARASAAARAARG